MFRGRYTPAWCGKYPRTSSIWTGMFWELRNWKARRKYISMAQLLIYVVDNLGSSIFATNQIMYSGRVFYVACRTRSISFRVIFERSIWNMGDEDGDWIRVSRLNIWRDRTIDVERRYDNKMRQKLAKPLGGSCRPGQAEWACGSWITQELPIGLNCPSVKYVVETSRATMTQIATNLICSALSRKWDIRPPSKKYK